MLVKTTTAALIAVILLVGAVSAAKIKVRVQAEPTFDGREVRTWAWAADGPGQVRMARSSQDDPEALRRTFEPTVVDAVAKELGARGIMPGPAATADVNVHYYLLVTVGFDTQSLGQFLPAVPEWGIPPFTGGTTSYEIIQTGSLVLDLVSPKLQRIVWRGIAQAEIDSEKNDDQRKTRIREAVRDLVEKFPKKK